MAVAPVTAALTIVCPPNITDILNNSGVLIYNTGNFVLTHGSSYWNKVYTKGDFGQSWFLWNHELESLLT